MIYRATLYLYTMTSPSPKPPRESNFELLRLVAMAMVLILHADFYSLGDPSHALFSRDAWAFSGRAFWEFLALPAVNLFVLISGWFGIRPSWRGALNLLFTVFFFNLLAGVVLTVCGESFETGDFLKSLYPCGGLWFIQSYLLLFILSPVLNAFIASADRSTMERLLLAFFASAFLLGWIRNTADFSDGYSVVWFMALYLFARYMRLHRPAFTRLPRPVCLGAFLVCTLLNCGLFFLSKHPSTAGAMKASGIQTVVYESPFTFWQPFLSSSGLRNATSPPASSICWRLLLFRFMSSTRIRWFSPISRTCVSKSLVTSTVSPFSPSWRVSSWQ